MLLGGQGFFLVDPLADQFPEWSAYNYVMGNPIRLVDPDGRAPDDVIIRITDQVVGSTQIRLIGSEHVNGAPSTVEVPLYLMTVTDDVTGTVSEYHVARDGPVMNQSDPVNEVGFGWSILGYGDTYNVNNTAFEPASDPGNYKGVALAYPSGSGLEAFALRTQSGSPNLPTDPARGTNSAEGVMIHVGGSYTNNGSQRITGSLGCFGLCGKDEGNQGVKNFVSDVVRRRDKNKAAGAGSAVNIQVDKRQSVGWTWEVDDKGTKQ